MVGADAYLDHNSVRHTSSLGVLDDLSADRARLDTRIGRSASSQSANRRSFVVLDDLNADRGRLISRNARLDDSQVSQSQQSNEDTTGFSRASRLDDSQASQSQRSQETEIILSRV